MLSLQLWKLHILQIYNHIIKFTFIILCSNSLKNFKTVLLFISKE